MVFINSPASCCGLPTPDEENDSLAGIGLGVNDQLLRIVHRRRRCDDNDTRHDADQRHRRQFFGGVVGHLVLEQKLVDRDFARCAGQQRVAIGRRLGDRIGGDHARWRPVGSRRSPVWPKRRLHAARPAAAPTISTPPPGGIADENADRVVGIGCRSASRHADGSRRSRGPRRIDACSACVSSRRSHLLSDDVVQSPPSRIGGAKASAVSQGK